MKAIINYSLGSMCEKIDLEDYGIEPDRNWTDLTEKEQIEIKDILVEEKIISVSGHNEDPNV